MSTLPMDGGLVNYETEAAKLRRQRAIVDRLRQQFAQPQPLRVFEGGSTPLFGQSVGRVASGGRANGLLNVLGSALASYGDSRLDKREAENDKRASEQAAEALRNFPQLQAEKVTPAITLPAGQQGPTRPETTETYQRSPAEYQGALTQWAGGLDPTNPHLKDYQGKVLEKTMGLASDEFRRDSLEGIAEMRLAKEAATGDPAAVKRYKFYQTLDAAGKRMFADSNYAPKLVNQGDVQQIVAPGGQAVGQPFPVNLKPGELPATRQAQAQATAVGKAAGEAIAGAPAAAANVAMADAENAALQKNIALALEQSEGLGATGFLGQYTKGIGGTPAGDLASTLNSVAANSGLAKMAELKAATGSTGLGAITEGEHKLLQSLIEDISQTQSKPALQAKLKSLAKFKAESNARIRAEYERLYGPGGKYAPAEVQQAYNTYTGGATDVQRSPMEVQGSGADYENPSPNPPGPELKVPLRSSGDMELSPLEIAEIQSAANQGDPSAIAAAKQWGIPVGGTRRVLTKTLTKPTAAAPKYKLKPGANPKLKSSYEEY